MEWRGIETAPAGYDIHKGFRYVLFYGFSKAGSFAEPVYISGWMDMGRNPIHNHHYALTITHWSELPPAPGAKS